MNNVNVLMETWLTYSNQYVTHWTSLVQQLTVEERDATFFSYTGYPIALLSNTNKITSHRKNYPCPLRFNL